MKEFLQCINREMLALDYKVLVKLEIMSRGGVLVPMLLNLKDQD